MNFNRQKLYLVVNPHGGMQKGLGILEQVKPEFEKAGIELNIIETEYAGHARDIINGLDMDTYDGFVIIGGDGTLHEVINGLLTRSDKKQIPIGLIPGGSGNSFMYTLDCLDPIRAARNIISGNTMPVDVIRIKTNDRTIYSINIIGWGLVTDIGVTAEKYRWIGESRYTLISIIEVLRLKQRSARIILDGKEEQDEFTFMLAMNTQYTGKGMFAAPKAKIDDGLMDVIIVREKGKLRLLNLLPKIFDGSHIKSEFVDYSQVKELSLIPETNEPLNIDGEIMGNTPIEVKVLPGMFKFYRKQR